MADQPTRDERMQTLVEAKAARAQDVTNLVVMSDEELDYLARATELEDPETDGLGFEDHEL
jgi:hypothetical protein